MRYLRNILPVLFITVIALTGFSSEKVLHSDSIDVVHYNISLEIIDIAGKTIAGNTEIRLKPIVPAIQEFALDFESLTVDSILNQSGQHLVFSQSSVLLHIHTSQQYYAGQEFSVFVYYHGQPKLDPAVNGNSGWGGFYFGQDRAFNIGVAMNDVPHNYGRVWYPCIDDFIDKATYDFRITTKNYHKAVCGGILIDSVQNADSSVTWHWKMNQEISSYLSSVAVGNYVAYRDTFHGAEENIPIEIWSYPEHASFVPQRFAKLNQALQIFEESFGTYKWDRVGYVEVPFGGGAMEHATNIAYPDWAFESDYESLYVHELAHSWFGNLITCSNAGDMWINEGWASYCEYLFNEKVYGRDTYSTSIKTQHKNLLQNLFLIDGGNYALSDIPLEITYGTTVYDRGAMVAHSMRGYLGDSVFFDAIKALLTEFSFKSASDEDVRDFLTTYTGIDMSGFYNSWVFQPGYVHYSVDSFLVSTQGQNYNVEVFARTKLKDQEEYSDRNLFEITFVGENLEMETHSIQFDGRYGSQEYSIAFLPVFIIVDKEQKLCDATVDEIRTISSTGTSYFSQEYMNVVLSTITDSIFFSITHNWVEPDYYNNPYNGLVISPNRYWDVNGIAYGAYSGKLKFKFDQTSSTGFLDEDLLAGMSKDSIVLLYRPKVGDPWQILSTSTLTSVHYGYLITDTVLFGQYTVGVWDKARFDTLYYAFQQPGVLKNFEFSVFPNPSDDVFHIHYEGSRTGLLQVFNMYGEEVFRRKIQSSVQDFDWSPGCSVNHGTLFIRATDAQGLSKTIKAIYY